MMSFAVVDDSLVARMAARKVLKELGFSISEFPSGEALVSALAAGETFGAILLDITMPGMSGTDILETVKKTNPMIPVIMVTADIQKKTQELVHTLGAEGMVGKPITSDAIREILDRLRISGRNDG